MTSLLFVYWNHEKTYTYYIEIKHLDKMQRLKSFDRETSQGLFRRMSKEYEVLSQNICYTVEKKPLNITSWGRSSASTWRDKVSMYIYVALHLHINYQTN